MEYWLIVFADLFGTAIFAITGAVKGIACKLDMLGVIVLGCTVGIGGGVMRDAALGATPAAALSHSTYLILCILVSLIVFLLPRRLLTRNRELIVWLDALGIGVFTVLGNAKARQLGMPPITIVLSGVITATGGGVLRDVLVRSIPVVLRSDFYATASLIGGLLYLVLGFSRLSELTVFLIVALTVSTIRIIAYRKRLQLPR